MSMTLLVENLFNHVQNPTHVLASESEQQLHEVQEVGNGRRHPFSYWAPTTSNNDTWVSVDCAVAKDTDFVAVDRNSNLPGHEVRVQYSDNGSTWFDAFANQTVPSAVTTGDLVTATPGVLTVEGAWVYRYASVGSHRYWRLWIDAMGAGLIPEVGGLYLGKSWTPGMPQVLPHHKLSTRVGGRSRESDFGWHSFATRYNRREGALHMKLDSIDAPAAQTFFSAWAKPGTPAWMVQDDANAERAFLAIASPGSIAEFFVGEGWWRDTLRVRYVEHEPKPL